MDYVNNNNRSDNAIKADDEIIRQKDSYIRKQSETIQRKNKIIRQLRQKLKRKEQEIDLMLLSKFWKLRNVYLHYKNGLQQSVCSPGLFFVFLKKRIHKLDAKLFRRPTPIINNSKHKDEIFLKNNFAWQNIDWVPSARDNFRLNLVIDGIRKTNFVDGLEISLASATLFAKRNKIPLRIIAKPKEITPQDYLDFLKEMNIKVPHKVTFFFNYNERVSGGIHEKLSVSDKDIFLVTSRQSARIINNINQRDYFFFISQEDEKVSNSNGAGKDNNIKCIINIKLLNDRCFKQGDKGIIKNACCYSKVTLFDAYKDKKILSKNNAEIDWNKIFENSLKFMNKYK